jgi:protocatechuate 3,4-dioxygenase beta subunit
MKLMLSLLIAAFLFAAQAPQVADKNAPAKIAITSKDEPGERLIVTGRVFAPDGRTPLPGVSLYVYQTGKDGIYSKPVNDSRNPRLRGYLRTDAEGRYEYSTIKPGSYPNTNNPAHIHYVVTAPGYQEKIFEIVFADDPLVNDRIRADAAKEDSGFSIRPLTRDGQGVLRCTQDIKLKK